MSDAVSILQKLADIGALDVNEFGLWVYVDGNWEAIELADSEATYIDTLVNPPESENSG